MIYLNEVSSKVIIFQMEWHSLIIWARSSSLFTDNRILDDMLHDITINREFKNKNYIYAFGFGES